MKTVLRAVLDRFDLEAASAEPEPMRMHHITFIPGRGGELLVWPRRSSPSMS
jgi:hypothetical protein